MNDISTILTIAAAVLGILGIAVALIGFVRAGVNEAQIKALRGDRDDLRVRVDLLEKDKVRDEAEIDKLKTSNSILVDMARGKDELMKLQGSLDAHHTEHTQLLNGLSNLVQQIARTAT